jgi:MoaA/NifB/PqqE/SkfB family radical SAM enzyme
MLRTLDCIQVSIGGLNAETYFALYGVDRYSQVEKAMERLLTVKAAVSNPAEITFAFRTNDLKFEKRFRQQIESYRRRGAFVSHICAYANYAGVVQENQDLNLKVIGGRRTKHLPCIYPSVHMAVCWDGKITACGCADFNADALVIGNAEEETLSQVWFGAKRGGVMNSFARGRLFRICRECSAYQPDAEIFSAPYCKQIMPSKPLPIEYFRQFWGG